MNNDDFSRSSRLTTPHGRRIMWAMIPVLMAIILILNQTAPTPPRLPAALSGIRVLPEAEQRVLSVIVQSAVAPTESSRDLGQGFWAIRLGDLESAGTLNTQPLALAALGFHANELMNFSGLSSPLKDSSRLAPDFPERLIAQRLDNTEDFLDVKNALAHELRNAMAADDSALRLLERMALENLPPNWHLLMAERLESITLTEWQAWRER